MKLTNSILLFLLGIVLLSSINIINKISVSINEINSQEIQKNLRFQEKLLEKTLIEYSKHNIQNINSELQKNNFTILVYKNNSIIKWTDNNFVYNIKWNKLFENKGVYKIGSYIVISKILNENNLKYVGFFIIKNDFAFENEYLKNTFSRKLQIPDNYDINFENNNNRINLENGDFAFSLIKKKDFYSLILTFIYNILFIIAIAVILIAIRKILYNISGKYNPVIYQFITIASYSIIWILFFNIRNPILVYYSPLFSPFNYAQSGLFPSFGDFILATIFILGISYNYFKYFNTSSLKHKKTIWYNSTFIAISSILIVVFYTVFLYLLNSLIFNSNINIKLYELKNLNIYSALFYFSIFLLLLSFFLFLDKTTKILATIISLRKTILFFLIIFLPTFILLYLLFFSFNYVAIIYFVLLVAIVLFANFYKKKYTYWLIVIITLLSSIFIGYFSTIKSNEKEKDLRKLFAVGISSNRDFVAESQFADFEYKIINDSKLGELIQNPNQNNEAIYKHINNNYFHSYWSKFSSEITICGSKKYFNEENETSNCRNYFNYLIKNYGRDIPGSGFKYLDVQDGRIHYFTIFNYRLPADSSEVNIYIELISKLRTEKLGFPKLLIANYNDDFKQNSDYSYSKYVNNKLIFEYGNYFYNLTQNISKEHKNEFTFVDRNDYNHLIYRNKDNITIVSVKEISFINYMATHSYLFVFFTIMVLALILITNPKLLKNMFTMNLKNTIQFSMIGILIFSLITIGISTAFLSINQSKKTNTKEISEKTQSIIVELQQKFGNYKKLNKTDADYIKYLLEKWSYVFFTDINIYDKKGNLISSSRPEIFEKKIIGTLINPLAYEQIYVQKNSEYIHNENIGYLDYTASYTPLLNNKNEILAYVNLSYFSKKDTFSETISDLIITLLNIYALLSIITIFAGILLSQSITRPLFEIKQKFGEINLIKVNTPVIYKRKDEIGELVNEYNRVISELEENAKLLAKSERESAWREMAKQIAHEIKNPLTPMKLSIQYLLLSWKNKDKDFDSRINNVSITLVEQIDALSNIASEFSDFAKIPRTQKENVNLYSLITNVVELFKNDEIKFEFINVKNKELTSFIDKEQLLRVFNNLIKNAIQSVPVDRNPIILIEIEEKNKNAIIKITDNGKGIPTEIVDKLFIPNFTTKTSGSGLGLAICKNIIEMSNGKIYFNTIENKGSTFVVELPIL